MKLRTTFNIPPFLPKITYHSTIFSMGSCFSTMLGNKLLQRKFHTLNNPFGTIFNPVSLCQLLQQSLSNSKLDASLLLKHQQRFYHYGVHSSISSNTQDQLWEKIEASQSRTKKFLSQSSHIFITFGTAFIYELKANGKMVSNCHKQAQQNFQKRLLGLEEMKGFFGDFYSLQKSTNPSSQIILTLSPVRHTSDGVPENQHSKSLLLVLIHQLMKEHKDVSYFPSYELMMDDLRDYRFYREDMVHPTRQAEDYIWDHFQKCYFDRSTEEAIQKIEEINTALLHRPFQRESKAHHQFLQNLLQKMERLTPEFDFSKEIREIKMRLGTDY